MKLDFDINRTTWITPKVFRVEKQGKSNAAGE